MNESIIYFMSVSKQQVVKYALLISFYRNEMRRGHSERTIQQITAS